MIDDDRVVHEVRYAHPVDSVWHALTDSAALADWLMPNDFSPTLGHRFRLDARPQFGFIDCEVVAIEAPHLLQCRWDIDGTPTTVTIRLEADREGTVLRLEHDGIPRDRRDGFDGGWTDKLQRDLGLVLAGNRVEGERP